MTSALAMGGSALASYAYLGAGSVIRVDYEQPDVRLDLWGGTVGSYDGIDRFGRVTDHRWEAYNGSSTDLERRRCSPPVLRASGLGAALRWLASHQQREVGLTVNVEAEQEAEPLREEIRVLLFRRFASCC